MEALVDLRTGTVAQLDAAELTCLDLDQDTALAAAPGPGAAPCRPNAAWGQREPVKDVDQWLLSAQRRHQQASRPRSQFHPTRQFAPAALNAGFAPHCRRSDARGLTSQIDPNRPLGALDNFGRVRPLSGQRQPHLERGQEGNKSPFSEPCPHSISARKIICYQD